VKPGYKTTEFYISIATIAGTFISALAGALPASESAGIVGGVAVVYALARAIVKVSTAFTATQK
jgi:hypothetical protein